MSRKLSLGLGLLAILCMLAALLGPTLYDVVVFAPLTFPFAQLGKLLQNLSLAGNWGNAGAILLFGALGLCPLLPLIRRLLRKKARGEDILLLVMSVLVFIILYLAVNPTVIKGPQYKVPAFPGLGNWVDTARDNIYREFISAALGAVFYSLLVSYLTLRLLRRFRAAETLEMLDWLRLFFAFLAAVLIFKVFYLVPSVLSATFEALAKTNTHPAIALGATKTVLTISLALEQVPNLMGIWLLILTIRLIELLQVNRYAEQAVKVAGRLSAVCRSAVIAIIFSSLAANLLQLLFSRHLVATNINFRLPLVPLGLTLSLLVLTRYLADSSRLHKENRLFI